MFTRIVELTTKPGKNRELPDTIDDKVLNASFSRLAHSSVSLFFKNRNEYSFGQGVPRSASSTVGTAIPGSTPGWCGSTWFRNE